MTVDHAMIDERTATKIMGWTLFDPQNGATPWWIKDGCDWLSLYEWNPSEDRNQSRMVVDATLRKINLSESELTRLVKTRLDDPFPWIYASPADECYACLMVVDEPSPTRTTSPVVKAENP